MPYVARLKPQLISGALSWKLKQQLIMQTHDKVHQGWNRANTFEEKENKDIGRVIFMSCLEKLF